MKAAVGFDVQTAVSSGRQPFGRAARMFCSKEEDHTDGEVFHPSGVGIAGGRHDGRADCPSAAGSAVRVAAAGVNEVGQDCSDHRGGLAFESILVLSSQFAQSSRPQDANTKSNNAFAARSIVFSSSASDCHTGAF